MRLLITNDDGIHSPGLAALAKAATEFGEVRVVAPDVERSSTGHAITASHPLSYRPHASGTFRPGASTARRPTASRSACTSGKAWTRCSRASISV